MILTITLNPSVDISYRLESLTIDAVNRVGSVSKTAGGKGLNVSRVLRQLGENVSASGFLGGHLGDFITTKITEDGIQDWFVRIKGETRNCIALLHDEDQTEVLEAGPTVEDGEIDLFIARFSEYVKQVDIVMVSGSLPKGVPDDFYQTVIEISNSMGKPVLLDTKSTLLEQVLTSGNKPFLIKPNQSELAALTHTHSTDVSDIIQTLYRPLFSDVPWVVVTLGAEGAIIKHHETVYRATIPKVNVQNPVGSGDAVVAGFAAGLSRGFEGKDLIRFSLAMGVLNAMEHQTGSINTEDLDWCVNTILVDQL